MSKSLDSLRIRIFADGADKAGILSLNANPLIKGLTTNPTLMRKAGIQVYEGFAKDVLASVTAKPISFEVFSDEFPEMRRQALKIAAWQKNVYVKIPITNTRTQSSLPLIKELGQSGVQLNITAILTLDQVRLLKSDNVVSDRELTLADLGIVPDSVQAVVPSYLWRFRPKGQYETEINAIRESR